MEQIHEQHDPAAESAYQKQLETARALGESGQFEQAEEAYRQLIGDYPEKFGAWWGYARLFMDCRLALDPWPPYGEIDLESTMLRKAFDIADNSQKLFIKQKIGEYQEAWLAKCDVCRQKTREILKEFPDFAHFAKNIHGTYEAVQGDGQVSYRLVAHGKKLCFEKVTRLENGKTNVSKYTYNNWDDHNYRLEGLYDETEDFELYVKDFDGQRLVLGYTFPDGNGSENMFLEMDRKQADKQ